MYNICFVEIYVLRNCTLLKNASVQYNQRDVNNMNYFLLEVH